MKKKIWKARLPKEVIEVLRHKGGPQTTEKGGRGYDRKKEKQKERRRFIQGS